MDKLFETAVFTRSSMLKIIENKSYKELVKIPENFNNSIFWNIAHLMVTQQLLCYRMSGRELLIDEAMVSKYGKGSIATEDVKESDIQYVKDHLLMVIKASKKDYEKGILNNFNPYMTSTGIELKSIEDAIIFNGFHDGIHVGVVLSLMKIV